MNRSLRGGGRGRGHNGRNRNRNPYPHASSHHSIGASTLSRNSRSTWQSSNDVFGGSASVLAASRYYISLPFRVRYIVQVVSVLGVIILASLNYFIAVENKHPHYYHSQSHGSSSSHVEEIDTFYPLVGSNNHLNNNHNNNGGLIYEEDAQRPNSGTTIDSDGSIIHQQRHDHHPIRRGSTSTATSRRDEERIIME